MIIGYIGSYASKDSQSIVRFVFDEEKEMFVKQEDYLPWPDSKYLSLKDHTLLSIVKKDKAGIGLWDLNTQMGEELYDEEGTSCYITQDDTHIYTANYHEGTLSIYDKKPLRLRKRILIQKHAGCHQVILYDHYLLLPCLLLDMILIFDCEKDYAKVNEITLTKGSGPRHGVMNQAHTLYLVSELRNQLLIYHMDGEKETLHKVVDLVNEKEKGAAAAIRMSKDERFLYISIREANEIVVYHTKEDAIIQRIDCRGDHPRDIALCENERYLFVANRFTNTMNVFKRHPQYGTLEPCLASLAVNEAVSIVFEHKMDKNITVIVDRPLGSKHPKHELWYPINYGYVEGVIAGDGEAQDVYILGVDKPVEIFKGELIAVVKRSDDCEDKWVAAPKGCHYTIEEIETILHFQEQYFQHEIVLV